MAAVDRGLIASRLNVLGVSTSWPVFFFSSVNMIVIIVHGRVDTLSPLVSKELSDALDIFECLKAGFNPSLY